MTYRDSFVPPIYEVNENVSTHSPALSVYYQRPLVRSQNRVIIAQLTRTHHRQMGKQGHWKVLCYLPQPHELLQRCAQRQLCPVDMNCATSQREAMMLALRDIAEEAGLTRDEARPEFVLLTKDAIEPVPALRVQSRMRNMPKLSREGHEKLRGVLGQESTPKWVWLNNWKQRAENLACVILHLDSLRY